MFSIINKQILGQDVKRLDVSAKAISHHIQPGQYVVVVPEDGDAWIPLAVVEADSRRGSITLIVKEQGFMTKKLAAMPIHDSLFSVMGPFGKPATITKDGVVLCVSTGSGSAQILSICRAFKNAGNKVISLVGAKTKRSVFMEAQVRLSCHKLIVVAEDSPFEQKGAIADVVRDLIPKESISLVYAIGGVSVLKDICDVTKENSVRTKIQVSPFILCGGGSCGSCRVKVGSKILLACQDGPEFDGHAVDFNYLMIRMRAFDRGFLEDRQRAMTSEKHESNFFKKIFHNK